MPIDLPSTFPASTTTFKGSMVQVISSVCKYTVLPPQCCTAIVFAVFVERNSAVEPPLYFLEEGPETVVYGLAVKLSRLLLQLHPADCASPQLRI